MTHALAGYQSSHSSIVAAVGDRGSYSSTRRLWNAVYNKVFECTRYSADRIHRQLCQVYGHSRLYGQHISCRSSAGRCLIIIHLIARTSRPVISIFFYISKNSCPVNVFRMTERRRWMPYSGSSPSVQTSTSKWSKHWSHGMTNVSIPEVNMLKNSPALAVYIPINFSLTLIVLRAGEIGYTQPCIKSRGKSATHFVYFWSRKTLP